MLMGALGGILAAILSAVAWACLSVLTGHQIGYMAVAVGYLVGIGVRLMGKGIDTVFGYMGAILALFGCLLGNFLAIVYYLSQELGSSYLQALNAIDYNMVLSLMIETCTVPTLIFYGMALYEGYHFAFRRIAEGEMPKD